MPEMDLTLDEFVREVRESALDRDFDRPVYTLVLGAGASRSAGIPVAREMVQALRKLARIRKIGVAGRPKGESELSWLFRKVFGAATAHDDHVTSGRQFLLACIRRSAREANLTHLVAAHLSTMGVFNPIVTTNFDDQALAGFWSLPWSSADTEPHLMYEPVPAAASSAGIAEGVPIIIKAHGHHTTYGMRMLDDEIDSIAASVASQMARLMPSRGFVVVGYSGGWNDGVMRALAQPMPGKRIYWLYTGDHRPANENIERACAANTVKFVPILDADLAFLRLWFAVPSEDEILSSDGFTDEDLIVSFRPGWRPRGPRPPGLRAYDWFNPNLVEEGGALRLQDPGKFEDARRQLLPILDRIDALDEERLHADCIGEPPDGEGAIYSEIDRLSSLVPMDFEWTRRNRRILRFGLMTKAETGLELSESTFLLSKLCADVGRHGW
jgi:hypothetical protein